MIDELQQRFAIFFSQVTCTLQSLTCLGNKTNLMLDDIEKLKLKVSELESTLLKVRPHSLTRLDRALSDTFPPLKYLEGDRQDMGDRQETSLNRSLLHGLREVEGQSVGVEEVVRGSEGEGAGLPISGDLPTEAAATTLVEGEDGEGGGCEGVRGQTELSECETVATNLEPLEKSNHTQSVVDSDLREPALCTLNPTPYSTIQPTYATAVSNPFHPSLKGSSTVSKCPDSIPTNDQSCTSRPVQPTTTTVSMATVSMDTHNDNHHSNEDQSLSSKCHTINCQMEPQNTTTEDMKNDFEMSQESRLDRSNLAVQLTDVLGEGFGAVASSRPAGWSEWSDGGNTHRCDSSLSLHSSSSSGEGV